MNANISCPPNICWSETLSAKRQKAATQILGKTVVLRIIGFSLFLLGAKREAIALAIGMPLGTLLSFLTRMSKFGMNGLDDRRLTDSEPDSEPDFDSESLKVEAEHQGEEIVIRLPSGLGNLNFRKENKIQAKVVILTLANNGILTWLQAAKILDYSSPTYLRSLGDKLSTGDVKAIYDQRAGQTSDYRIGEEEKGLLITQWASNVVTGAKCSSRALASDLNEHRGIFLSDRTIRHHMKKFGLVGMQNTLSSIIGELKKN
jgi:hypothetical protein